MSLHGSLSNFYRLETSSHDLSHYNRLLEAPLDNRRARLRLSGGPGLGHAFNLDFFRHNALDGFDDRAVRG